MPFVVQYNKRDLADSYSLEELHRKLAMGNAAVFETVATERTGVLQTLSTISKRVIRTLRERRPEEKPEPAAVEPPIAAVPPTVIERPALEFAPAGEPVETAPPPPPSPSERMEEAILREPEHPEWETIDAAAQQAESQLDTSWERVAGEFEQPAGIRMGPDLSIVSVGEATRTSERAVRVPLVLGDGDGNTSTLVLTIQLDPLMDEN
jgi:hypothetical protein